MVSEIMGPSFVQGRPEGSPTATVLGMLFLVRKEEGEKPSKGAAPSTLTSSAPFPARHRHSAIPQSSDRRQTELKRFNEIGRAEPERFNEIGRAGCVFFRKSFVVHSLRAFHRPAPRSRLVLRKNSPRHQLSSQLNRSGYGHGLRTGPKRAEIFGVALVTVSVHSLWV